MTKTITVRYVWRARTGEVAHAQSGRSSRTACGRPGIDERLHTPTSRRCADCARIVAAAEATR